MKEWSKVTSSIPSASLRSFCTQIESLLHAYRFLEVLWFQHVQD